MTAIVLACTFISTPILACTFCYRSLNLRKAFLLSRQKNPQPADNVKRSENKRPREGSRRMALSGPKTCGRLEEHSVHATTSMSYISPWVTYRF